MITHISIQDFAIIKELSVDLHPGLNIITGETGAGKSIIIEAISMALGSRADTDYVRSGAEKATVTMIVDTDDLAVDDILDEIGADIENPMVLHRQISAVGKSVCRINGCIVPLSALNKLCKRIADIHGQYDHQSLLNVENHVEILDSYGKEDIEAVRGMTADFYKNYIQTVASLNKLKAQMADSERQKDLLAYELAEIRSAALLPGEDEALCDEIKLMQNSEKIFETLTLCYSSIFSQERSASDLLGTALQHLEGISGYSKDIDDISQSISQAYYTLEDMSHTLRKHKDSMNFSAEELDEKISRLDVIDTLKRKYGGSIERIFAYAQKAENSLRSIENADEETAELENRQALLKEQYETACQRLSALRKRTAVMLSGEITKELQELHFKDGLFLVKQEVGTPGEKGTDSIEFLISANKGEAPKPLAKVASGGELSRIMLAMKRIIGDLDHIPTMIFDEIDSGISGATAGIVGKKLESIAKTHQVICITHLPQIAAFGDHHYRIGKISDEISTHTTVTPLNEEQKIEELARLLSGTSITDLSRETAKELLKLSRG